jgi:hypothetical protein
MFTLTHLAVGGALGGWTGHGGTAFAVGVASHAVLDVVPHYDIRDVRVDVGLLVAAVAALWVLGYGPTPVFWGAAGGVLPDLEILLWRLGVLDKRRWVFPSHNGRIPHGREVGRRGLVVQGLLILGAAGCLAAMRS